MGTRSGTADLPLHHGRVPRWLADRMATLGRVIIEAIVLEYGRDEVLRRLAHPFWFQSFGAVMGMDWHSSGITTSVLGALKRGLQPVQRELGIYVCGGRGRHSRRTPDELLRVAELEGLDGRELVRSSRLVAKVDSAAVQDGFQIYLHGFVLAADGSWTVVQQGMSDGQGTARRYHWTSPGLGSFLDAPHAAIAGRQDTQIINLADARATRSRGAQLELVHLGPDAVVGELLKLRAQPRRDRLNMPAHHDVRESDLSLRRLRGRLAAAADRGPVDFPELLLTPGVGARTVQSLALVAEVLHGAPSRFDDPARFSFAHGGKDGHPFPVPLKVYDRTIGVLRHAVDRARLGQRERLDAVRRLDHQSRLLEKMTDHGASWDQLVAQERAMAPRNGGRTVMDDRPARAMPRPRPRQLGLFG